MVNLNTIASDTELLGYIESGNSTITIKHNSSSNHATFRFKKHRIKSYIQVYMLSGLDNTKWSNYSILGVWHANSLLISPRMRIRPDNKAFQHLVYMLRNVVLNKYMNIADVTVYKSSFCTMCGKKLTSPESLKYGYGRYCLQKAINNGVVIISDKDDKILSKIVKKAEIEYIPKERYVQTNLFT